MAAAKSSRKVVYAALAGNALVALKKFVAAGLDRKLRDVQRGRSLFR
jgi:hypothetical protein